MTTTTTDPDVAGETLHAALPIRAQVHITRTKKFDHDAAKAFDNGWHVDQLATRITTGQLGDNPGGVITTRLEQAATTPPPTSKKHTLPFCDRIQDIGPSLGMTCRELHGWIEDDEGRPIRKCACRTRPQEGAA